MGALKGRRVLVVAPHPDDEVIGAGALISHLVRRWADVRVIIVTDGAASHALSPTWSRSRLVLERRRESRRALRRLGIFAGHVHFLNLADGSLASDPRACRRALGQMVARYRDQAMIIGPDAADAHPDHRAVAEALSCLPSPARRLSYQVWPHDRRSHAVRLKVSAGTASVKRSLLCLYRTQLNAIRDDPDGFSIARHELDAFSHPIERFGISRR